MAVVISDNGKDNDRYTSQGLDIQKVIDEMARIDENGADIEDRFKDPTNPFFVSFRMCYVAYRV